MTALVLSALFTAVVRPLLAVGRSWNAWMNGIREARAMALLYQSLADLSDGELAARGLKRQDIPGAVHAACKGA